MELLCSFELSVDQNTIVLLTGATIRAPQLNLNISNICAVHSSVAVLKL